jgi:putative membrane protein
MKRTFVKISFLVLLITGISCNNNRDQSASGSQDSKEVAEEQNEDKFESKEMRKDADFVADQVAANYAEVELARLAAEKSSNSDVKRIAQKLVTEHQKNIKELGKLATEKAISVPSQAEDDDLKTVTDLRDENDAKDFNNQWCKEMIDKHESAIKDYENQLENTEDPELKTWISNTLPGLRTHLDELKACHDKMKDA